MAITVKDIHEKEFTRQVRGYSIEEVDDFLDEIAQQMEMLIRENRGYQQKLADKPAEAPAPEAAASSAQIESLIEENRALKEQLAEKMAEKPAEEAAPAAPAKDDSAYFRNLETTLRDTLVSAQRVAEDTMSEAQKKADELISSAEEQAGKILADAKAEEAQIQSESSQLRTATATYRDSFLRLVKSQLSALHADESLFE